MLILLEAYKLGEGNRLHPDDETVGKAIIQLTVIPTASPWQFCDLCDFAH